MLQVTTDFETRTLNLPKRQGKSSAASLPISRPLDENSIPHLERGIELPTFSRWQFRIQHLSAYLTFFDGRDFRFWNSYLCAK